MRAIPLVLASAWLASCAPGGTSADPLPPPPSGPARATSESLGGRSAGPGRATSAPGRDGTTEAERHPTLGGVGVLVMAHGGSDEWNRSIDGAVATLADRVPTAVAYGMADPETLAAGLDSLRSQGVDRVAVVRLFVSGRSFRDQTLYLLGLSTTPPERFVVMRHGDEGAAPHHDPGPIPHGLLVATHDDGLMESAEAARIVHDRLEALSTQPFAESVVLIAHGMGDEVENDEVLAAMESIVATLDDRYAALRVTTLREDWASPRAEAEAEIRTFVGEESAAGRRVIVVPMRLSGFGPYAEVLAGLEYVPAQGLLPHEAIADWIEGAAERVVCGAGWESPLGACPRTATDPAPEPR